MANLRVGLALLAGLSLIPAAAAVAQQQSQSSSQPKDKDKPKPKAKKVWSEDDVKELRTAADEYDARKAAEAEKAAAEKEKNAKEGADAAAPKKEAGEMSLEELNKQIDTRYEEIREHQQTLAALLRELYDSSSDQARAEADARIAHARETLLEIQLEHKKLVEMRDEMMAKKKAEAEGKPAEEAKPPVKPPVQ